jgi:hypothetical protein
VVRLSADGQPNVLCLATSAQPKRDRLAYAARPKRPQGRPDMTDRLTVPGDDDVALQHPRLGSWSLRFDLHHHHASSTILDADKLGLMHMPRQLADIDRARLFGVDPPTVQQKSSYVPWIFAIIRARGPSLQPQTSGEGPLVPQTLLW